MTRSTSDFSAFLFLSLFPEVDFEPVFSFEINKIYLGDVEEADRQREILHSLLSNAGVTFVAVLTWLPLVTFLGAEHARLNSIILSRVVQHLHLILLIL